MFRVITNTMAQTCFAEACLEPCKTTMMGFFCDNSYTAGIYHLKINKINTRTRCEICSKLTINIPIKNKHGVFIVNFEHISHLLLPFTLLTSLNFASNVKRVCAK